MILAWLAAAFVAGMLAGGEVVLPGTPMVFVPAAGAMVLLILWPHARMRLALLVIVAFSAGACRFEMTRSTIGPRTLAFYNTREAAVTGVITSEPDIRDRVSYYVVMVDHVAGKGISTPVSGQLQLQVASSQVFGAGDRVRLDGWLSAPVDSRGIPMRAILARRGILSEMSFPSASVTGHASLGLIGIAMDIRGSIASSIDGALPDPEATFLIAILIGSKTAQLGSLAPVLVQTGLIHLIAISGIKIAIVAGSVHAFLRRTMSKCPTLILSMTIVLGYWLVSGATVAGLRASIMWGLVFLAAYVGRPTFALVSLGIAATLMVTVSPQLLWDTGFELTTLATLSIVAFGPVFDRIFQFLPSIFRASLSTTTAAQVGILPLQLTSYGLMSPSSVVANGIVLPVIPLTMIVGFFTALFPQSPFATVSYGLVNSIIHFAEYISRLPLAWLSVGALPTAVSVAYYGLLVALALLAWKLPSRVAMPARGSIIVGLVVAIASLAPAAAAPAPPNELVFVANGAALISVDGHNVLVDGGTSQQALLMGLGESLPFSDREIDAIIDTDPESANVTSLRAVVNRYGLGVALDPGIEYASNTYGRWLDALEAKNCPVLSLRQGASIALGRMNITVLSPDRIYSNRRDGAGVIRITFEHRRILYIGPLSPRGQTDLPFRADVRARTVVSAVPITPSLLAATGAKHVILPLSGVRIPLP